MYVCITLAELSVSAEIGLKICTDEMIGMYMCIYVCIYVFIYVYMNIKYICT